MHIHTLTHTASVLLAFFSRLLMFSDYRRYFPYEEDDHRLVREIGNVTDKVEITFQFAVKPEKVESKHKIQATSER